MPTTKTIGQIADTINHGESGGHVSSLQDYMKKYGLYQGPVDGYYGDVTRNAVKKLQNYIGQLPTGIADSNVHSALNNLNSNPLNAVVADPLVANLIKTDPRVAATVNAVKKTGGAPAAVIVAAKNMNDRKVSSTGTGNNGEFDITGDPNDGFWKEAQKEEDPSYQQALSLYKNDFNTAIQKEKGDYAAFMANEENNLSADTRALDQSNAQNGILFSTARTQQRGALANKYNNEIGSENRASGAVLSGLGSGLEKTYGTGALNGYDLTERGATVEPGSLALSTSAPKPAYTPVGNQYGTNNTQYQQNLRLRYNLLKGGASGDLNSIPYGVTPQPYQ